jgi:uncharacterized protein YwgA
MSNYSTLLNTLVENYIPLKGDCKSGIGKRYQNTLRSIEDNRNIIAEINEKLNNVDEAKSTLLNIKNDLEFCKNNTTGGRRRKTRRNKKKSMKKKRRHTRKY